MQWYIFLWRNLVYYRSSHIWLMLGTLISTAIIVGALGVGDSLRYSLGQISFQRLGKVEYSFSSGRLVQIRLAREMSSRGKMEVSYALKLGSFAKSKDATISGVQLWCVDSLFWKQNEGDSPYLREDEAIVNFRLARTLGLKEGDSFLLRVDKASFFPKESSFSARGQDSFPLRLHIKKIARDWGNFDLSIHQIAPYNVFVSYEWVCKQLSVTDYANVFLVYDSQGMSLDKTNNILENCFQLEDIGVRLEADPEKSALYLKSPRVFLDDALAKAALMCDPQAQGILAYFVNSIQKGEKSTPYSFLCGAGFPFVPNDIKDGEILVNEWLAQDLSVVPGDRVEIAYFIPGDLRKMEESRSSFVVKKILPMGRETIAPYLMPDFPGLATSENCRDWNAGISIDFSKIRKKDEDYWKDYKGTPKGFISLQKAQTLWNSRYGSFTAIRYPYKSPKEILDTLQKSLSAKDFGLGFSDIRKQSLEASMQGVDFAQLFLGLSFFLVVAALLLLGLLFYWNMENRSQENASLMALGFFPSEIRRFYLYEGGIIVLASTILGTGAGILYTKVILYALVNFWNNAVRTSSLLFHIEISSLVAGFLGSLSMALATIVWTSCRFSLSPKQEWDRESLAYLPEESSQTRKICAFCLFLCITGVCGILFWASQGKGQEFAGAFFGAGFLMLCASILLCYLLFVYGKKLSKKFRFTPFVYIVRNCLRRKGRSLITIALLSCSLFLVVSVASNRIDLTLSASERTSGTGGFALWCETSLPFFHNPGTQEGRYELGLSEIQEKDWDILAIRSRKGDDASCLNLNRVSQPSLCGIPTRAFAEYKPFSFVAWENKRLENPWLFLEKEISPDVIPAFADYNTIVWGLGKKIGDRLQYQDETGKTFYIQLVAALSDSIFQGQILIAEHFFLQHFPSDAGIKKFLVYTKHPQSLSKDIARAMEDYGIEIVETQDRLYEFQKVPNTYLNIFLALGGLGIVLGTCGLAVLIKRNILERTREIAILQSLGFRNQEILAFLMAEYLFLVLLAMACAFVCSFISLLPAMRFSYHQIPWIWISALFLGIFLNALAWVFYSTRSALGGFRKPCNMDRQLF